MDNYIKKIEEWEDSFVCMNCDALDHTDFYYDRTVANGEVWNCKHCGEETMVDEMPKEGY